MARNNLNTALGMGHPLNGERAFTILPLVEDEDGREEIKVLNKLN